MVNELAESVLKLNEVKVVQEEKEEDIVQRSALPANRVSERRGGREEGGS